LDEYEQSVSKVYTLVTRTTLVWSAINLIYSFLLKEATGFKLQAASL